MTTTPLHITFAAALETFTKEREAALAELRKYAGREVPADKVRHGINGTGVVRILNNYDHDKTVGIRYDGTRFGNYPHEDEMAFLSDFPHPLDEVPNAALAILLKVFAEHSVESKRR